MLNRSELKRTWDRAHQDKPQNCQPETELVAFAEQLKQMPSIDVPLLDVGCGRGRNAFYLSQMGFTVHGCDLSPVAIGKARLQAQEMDVSADFLVADLTWLPYPDSCFSAAICIHVLPYHFKRDIVRGIGEMRRVLRPGGWVYLDLLACEDAEYGCGRELEKDTFLDPTGVPIHFSSRREISYLLDSFTVERFDRLELGSDDHRRAAWVVWARKI